MQGILKAEICRERTVLASPTQRKPMGSARNQRIAAEAAPRLDDEPLVLRETRRQHIADLRRRAGNLVRDIRAPQFHLAILLLRKLLTDVCLDQVCYVAHTTTFYFRLTI